MKKHIPNFITSLNLVCGCIGIGFLFRNNIPYAAWAIGFAVIFDFLDGLFARLLNVKSQIGKELDSLADMVSFGVLPGFIMFSLLENCFNDGEGWTIYVPFISFLIPLFSALRLAKFNIDHKQTESFTGLPTPANAIFIGSIPLLIAYPSERIPFISSIFANPGFLIMQVFLLSFLLVSPIPLFSLKFKDLNWSKNSFQYIFLLISLMLILLFNYSALPLIIFIYILLSIIKIPAKK
ncbi:MAG: CDP-diacylglycerol--serine O-phosphatidyltransferase [Bacteroidales bacterium]|jgi:CDP-diacylglycerol--serine O-phosphatidyltransferase